MVNKKNINVFALLFSCFLIASCSSDNKQSQIDFSNQSEKTQIDFCVQLTDEQTDVSYLIKETKYYLDVSSTNDVSLKDIVVTFSDKDKVDYYLAKPYNSDYSFRHFYYYFEIKDGCDGVSIVVTYNDQTIEKQYPVIDNDLNCSLISQSYNNWNLDNDTFIFTNYSDYQMACINYQLTNPKITDSFFLDNNLLLVHVYASLHLIDAVYKTTFLFNGLVYVQIELCYPTDSASTDLLKSMIFWISTSKEINNHNNILKTTYVNYWSTSIQGGTRNKGRLCIDNISFTDDNSFSNYLSLFTEPIVVRETFYTPS